MISTVTTSTITTVTAMVDFGVILGALAISTLIALLCTREFATASDGRSSRLLARSLNVCTVPLTMVFAVTLVIKVLDILT